VVTLRIAAAITANYWFEEQFWCNGSEFTVRLGTLPSGPETNWPKELGEPISERHSATMYAMKMKCGRVFSSYGQNDSLHLESIDPIQ
jgi:hypothetical protein